MIKMIKTWRRELVEWIGDSMIDGPQWF
jgi:hypothetical protein